MDKGAHFYKCDFQVHTPRDENWSGADAITDVERKNYSAELVLACRKKGLNADRRDRFWNCFILK